MSHHNCKADEGKFCSTCEAELEDLMCRCADCQDTDLEECYLCGEQYDAETMTIIEGEWVCQQCIDWHKEEKEDVHEAVTTWWAWRQHRKELMLQELKNFNPEDMITCIKTNCKPIVK